MQRVTYAERAPWAMTRARTYWLLVVSWLLFVLYYVVQATTAVVEHGGRAWPWTLGTIYMVVPLWVATRLLGRLGVLEEQHSTPTYEMRHLLVRATQIHFGGYALMLIVVWFFAR